MLAAAAPRLDEKPSAGSRSRADTDRVRKLVTWISVLLLGVACFAPWTEVTTFRGESLLIGAMNEFTTGGMYLLACVIGAAVGLLGHWRWITSTCAAVAVMLTVLMMYGLPGTMMQIGYQANVTWGAFLALVSSLSLMVLERPAVRMPAAFARDVAP